MGARSRRLCRGDAPDGREHMRVVRRRIAALARLGFGVPLSTGRLRRCRPASVSAPSSHGPRETRRRACCTFSTSPPSAFILQNVEGLIGVMRDLVADGNTVVTVDHDVRVLAACDHLVEMGPKAGSSGGLVVAQGSVDEVASSAEGASSRRFLRREPRACAQPRRVCAHVRQGGRSHRGGRLAHGEASFRRRSRGQAGRRDGRIRRAKPRSCLRRWFPP